MARQNGTVIRTEERRSKVIQLKIAGLSDRAIAEQLGVNRNTVNIDVKRRLAEVRSLDKEAVEREYQLQMERYSTMLLRWWPTAIGNKDSDPPVTDDKAAQAGHMVLDILRRMDIISGLIPDKP